MPINSETETNRLLIVSQLIAVYHAAFHRKADSLSLLCSSAPPLPLSPLAPSPPLLPPSAPTQSPKVLHQHNIAAALVQLRTQNPSPIS